METFVARVVEGANLNIWLFGEVLDLLSQSQAKAVMETLAARAFAHIEQTSLASIAALLSALMKTGEQEGARRLAILAAEQADPSDPEDVAHLLDELMKVGMKESWAAAASAKLAARAATHADLSTDTESLVVILKDAGMKEALEALAARASAHVERTTSGGIAQLLRALREKWADEAWAEEAVQTLTARAATHGPAGPVRRRRSIVGDDEGREAEGGAGASHSGRRARTPHGGLSRRRPVVAADGGWAERRSANAAGSAPGRASRIELP
ncbi:hypothetical protein ACFQ0M_07720 [Kitasatospora aburaviensis]